MKQTAIDWLFQQLWDVPKDKFRWHSLFETAKEMEKKQIINAIDYCRDKYVNSTNYYNETYGGNK